MTDKISAIMRIIPNAHNCLTIIFFDGSQICTDYIEFNPDGTFETGATWGEKPGRL